MLNQTSREFITKSVLATEGNSIGLNALSLKGVRRIIGANDKIRMCFTGVGNRGMQLLTLFMQDSDCEIAALC